MTGHWKLGPRARRSYPAADLCSTENQPLSGPLPSIATMGYEIALKLFRFLTMFQPLLSVVSRFRVDKRNLLETGVIIRAYNDHCSAPSSELLVWVDPPSLLG